MTVIKGDLLDVKDGIICHQVNCRKVAGAGLALQIREKWPEWYSKFKFQDAVLGTAWLWCVDGILGKRYVASFFAQETYGSGLQTDYVAFERCLKSLNNQLSIIGNHQVFMPSGIGCGLAGGDWGIIEPMIERYFPDAIIVEKV